MGKMGLTLSELQCIVAGGHSGGGEEHFPGMLGSFSHHTPESREGEMEPVSRYKLPSPASSTSRQSGSAS